MSDDAALLTLELPGRTEAPAAARQALTALNGGLHLVSEERLRDVQLIASELVTNAYRHGGGRATPIHLLVLATDEVLRVEISDPGSGFDPEVGGARSGSGERGWAPMITERLAHRWGVERGEGTTVWFEVDRPADSRSSE
jgi:anti-sigma regulatory factor (Ser/Thr protein kinase)